VKSELAFRGARVTIHVQGGVVSLFIDNGSHIVRAELGADGAALVGSELERAAHHLQRIERATAEAAEKLGLAAAGRVAHDARKATLDRLIAEGVVHAGA
jgi:2-methylaconitate cis-trans-isomerase PrpF